MAMILDQIVSIKRLKKDSDNSNKEQYVANLALDSVKCQIQPASAEETAIADGVYGQTFTLFTTESGLMTGDHVTNDDTGEVFRIRGVENWSLIDLIPHFEVTMVRLEDEELT